MSAKNGIYPFLNYFCSENVYRNGEKGKDNLFEQKTILLCCDCFVDPLKLLRFFVNLIKYYKIIEGMNVHDNSYSRRWNWSKYY